MIRFLHDRPVCLVPPVTLAHRPATFQPAAPFDDLWQAADVTLEDRARRRLDAITRSAEVTGSIPASDRTELFHLAGLLRMRPADLISRFDSLCR